MRGKIPHVIRRRLKKRKTNIIAYELIIAVAAITCFCPDILRDVDSDHYVDSQPATSCILKGSSAQVDLCDIAGRLWFECCHCLANYFVRYAQSKCNLADGPSRDDISLVSSLGFVEVPFNLPPFKRSLDSWRYDPSERNRLVV
eukprot:TRINITY_DN10768_c0_g1_i1.p1 TRINITY_DN10768_c0_g1~~TRINITY_DN10768_c0_g1_i1.p1  ORF type:complete len:144 (-),score=11.91 TRINITY_DN10768_c0_g1_i1:25-456(-)